MHYVGYQGKVDKTFRECRQQFLEQPELMKIVMVLEFGQLSYTACYLCLECIIITITPRFVYM